MAFYTTGINRIESTNRLTVLEGYHSSVGVSTALLENIENDFMLFESLIGDDFKELKAVKEGASDEHLEAMLEASLMSFVNKLKELLKRLWDKVVSIIDTAIKTLMKVIIFDNKKFVEMYEKQVDSKNLSKMTYKWSVNRKNADSVFAGRQSPDHFKLSEGNSTLITSYRALTVEKAKEKIELFGTVKHKEEMLAKKLGLSRSTEFSKALHDYKESLWKDRSEEKGVSVRLYKNIKDTLKTSKDIIKGFTDMKSEVNKIYRERLNLIKETERDIKKADEKDSVQVFGSDKLDLATTRDAKSVISKKIQAIKKSIIIEQEVDLKAIGILIQIVKWKIKECRAVFARAVTYKEKSSVNASAEYLDGLDDIAYHRIEEMFEGVNAY